MVKIELFKLFGRILIDNDEANKSLAKTDEHATGVGSKLGSIIGTAGKMGVAVVGAAGAAVTAVAGLAMTTADAAGGIYDSSLRVGVSAEEFQKYAYAAKLSGMETETLELAMVKAQKSFADATTGSKTASEAFNKLGIDVGKTASDEAFDLVVKRLADMKDETQRNALANDIFGKSYAELSPLLAEGSAGIQSLKNEAVNLGAVMSNDAVKAGSDFGDQLDSLNMSITGVFNQIGTALLPIVQELLSWVMDNMPTIKEVFGTVFGVISTVVQKVYTIFKENILPVLKQLWEWIEPNIPAIKEAFSNTFEVIWGVVKRVYDIFNENVLPILKMLWEWAQPTLPYISAAFKLAFDIIFGAVDAVLTVFEKVTGAIKTAMEWLNSWNKTPAETKTVTTVQKTEYVNVSAITSSVGNASGTTSATAGWAWVGERGPELVNFGGGERVYSNADSMRPSITIVNQGTLVGTNGMKEFADIMSQEMARKFGLSTGGAW